MSVLTHIERHLEGFQVAYSLTEIASGPKALSDVIELKPYHAARATVLKNEADEEVIAITCTDTLLDINKVDSALGSKHKALTGTKLENFMAKYGVDTIPALPAFNDIPTIVDQGLLEVDTVYLGTGVDSQYIKLAQPDFRQLLGDITINTIGTSISKLEVPVNPDQDRDDIEYSVSLFTERRIRQRLEETLEFPPLPITAERIIKLRVNPNADISDLTDIFELDASLSAQVVSWAASPYYSAPGSIKSIHDAIVRVLGFDMVMNLALGLSLGHTLKMPTQGPYGCLPYWQQSVYVATATEALVTCIPRENRPSFGTAYLAGLLNNFGSLVISEVFTNQFKAICDHIDANPSASAQAVERHIIGVDRNQIAAWLMGYWNMPDTIANALRHQCDPDYDGEDWQYALLLNAANKLLNAKGLLTGCSTAPLKPKVLERLNIDPQAAEEAIDNLLESHEELVVIAKQLSGS